MDVHDVLDLGRGGAGQEVAEAGGRAGGAPDPVGGHHHLGVHLKGRAVGRPRRHRDPVRPLGQAHDLGLVAELRVRRQRGGVEEQGEEHVLRHVGHAARAAQPRVGGGGAGNGPSEVVHARDLAAGHGRAVREPPPQVPRGRGRNHPAVRRRQRRPQDLHGARVDEVRLRVRRRGSARRPLQGHVPHARTAEERAERGARRAEADDGHLGAHGCWVCVVGCEVRRAASWAEATGGCVL